MLRNSKFLHVLSTLILALWGIIFLYFYATGRLASYLPPDGIFRPLVLISGVGLLVLAAFNLMTQGTDAGQDCCGHDHGHSHGKDACCGHDHGHSHGKDACCGHDHGHSHGNDACCGHDHGHSHGKDACCGHDHGHSRGNDACCGHDHGHSHGNDACCGHDHGHSHGKDACCGHDHEHSHGNDAGCGHDHGHEGHAHGGLEDGGTFRKLLAISLLVVPMSYAAVKTPDKFSPRAVMNKGLYNQNYGSTARADEFSLKKRVDAPAKSAPAVVAESPPAATPTQPAPGSTPVEDKALNMATGGAEEAKSYGSFTLADLEAQVPRSAEGYFQLEVPEIYYTASDKEVQNVLGGQKVETIAQVLPEKVNNDKNNRVRIFKLSVQCCAADARPYSIPVEFATSAPEFKEMGWVKIKGNIEFVSENDQIVPLIRAESMEATEAPLDQVVY